jgi:hypothetical protein
VARRRGGVRSTVERLDEGSATAQAKGPKVQQPPASSIAFALIVGLAFLGDPKQNAEDIDLFGYSF